MDLLRLLLVVLSVFIESAFSQKNGQAYELVPGVSFMQQGFDLNKLDLFPPPGQDEKDGRGQKNLFEFTFNKGKFFDFAKKRYSQPDQVQAISIHSKATLELTSSIHTTVDSHATSWGFHVGGEAGVDGFTAGGSVSYENSVKTMVEEDRISADVNGYLNSHYIIFDTSTDLEPTKGFKEDYAKLTGTYESNPEVFDKFLSEYGTHYYTKAFFGGQLSISLQIEKKYCEKKTKEKVEAEVHASVAGVGGFNAGAFYEQEDVHSELNQHTHTRIVFYGGEITQPKNGTFDDDALKEWQLAVERSPWEIGGLYTEIYNLVKDEDIKYELMNAMYSKFARQSLRIIKITLEALVETYKIEDTDPDLHELCNCTLADVRYYVDQNLGRHVPVRQEVLDIQQGVWNLTTIKRKFKWGTEG